MRYFIFFLLTLLLPSLNIFANNNNDHSAAVNSIIKKARYWNNLHLEKELETTPYLTKDEKQKAYQSCSDYLHRYRINTQISEMSDVAHFSFWGFVFGTIPGLCLFGAAKLTGQSLTDSSFPLKTAVALTTAPLWVGAYGVSAMKWDQRIKGNYGHRVDAIAKIPDYQSQD